MRRDAAVDDGHTDPASRHGMQSVAPGSDGIDDGRVGGGQQGGVEGGVDQPNRGVVHDARDVGIMAEVLDHSGRQFGGKAVADRHPLDVLDAGSVQIGVEAIEITASDDDDAHRLTLGDGSDDLAVDALRLGARPRRYAREDRHRQAAAHDHRDHGSAEP